MIIHECVYFKIHAFDLTTDVDGVEDFLDATEKEATQKMSKKRRREFTLSRYYLKHVLSKCTGVNPEKIVLKKTEHGKLLYKDTHFSISHSNNRLIVGLSSMPVGVDIEYCDPKRYWKDIAKNYFSIEEQEWINDDLKLFYTLWTLKESRFKAQGFSQDPDKKFLSLSFIDGVPFFEGYQTLVMPWHDYKIGMCCKQGMAFIICE